MAEKVIIIGSGPAAWAAAIYAARAELKPMPLGVIGVVSPWNYPINLALIPLVLFGGEVIRSFTIAMTFGCLVGMYSSIIVNGPILINFGLKAKTDEEKPTPKAADGASV